MAFYFNHCRLNWASKIAMDYSPQSSILYILYSLLISHLKNQLALCLNYSSIDVTKYHAQGKQRMHLIELMVSED